VNLDELVTPALVVDLEGFDHNTATMTAAWPGAALRPHVKAFKSTALAQRLADAGHRGFCCATVREVEGMAAAGLGDDLLLANEVLDASRLGALAADGSARVTVAVDSDETVAAAAAGGVREVLIDVNVGLPRCGCEPDDAGRLADLARSRGLEVRGVMGYEGHVVGLTDRAEREAGVAASTALLRSAHDAVGGEIVSGGGTGTWDQNRAITELQAGSYTLMDTAYAALGLPFRQAVWVLGTVISVNPTSGFAVADVGLKSLGMDHGNPSVDGGRVWFCSDEHLTFGPPKGTSFADWGVRIGDRVEVWPAHIDPTIAMHTAMHVVATAHGSDVVDVWPVDLRNW
jgi:D-serine deaminase-like pyridoxal phosphate-dependent protein